MHLKHPAMVGKKQFQCLAEEKDAQHPHSRGEDGHADKCPGLWGSVGAISVREGSGLQGSPGGQPQGEWAAGVPWRPPWGGEGSRGPLEASLGGERAVVSVVMSHLGGDTKEGPPWAHLQLSITYGLMDRGLR